MKKKLVVKTLTGTALGTALICSGLLMSSTAQASTWHANTPDQINIVHGQKEYTVKYGDTLWAISVKTNIKVQTLADASGITNPNLIQVGQKIILNGNRMTVKDAQGQTVSQTTLKPSDKVDASQKFGTPVHNTQALVNNNYTNPETHQTVNAPVQNVSNKVVAQPNTPAQPVNPSQDGNAGTTTPAQPTNPGQSGNAGSTTPAQPTKPSEGGNAGTTTPAQPTTPSQPETTVNYLSDPNDKNSFFNEEGLKQVQNNFIALVNQGRAKVGAGALSTNSEMQHAADVRGFENQTHHEQTGGYDMHKRPDGRSGLTAIPAASWKGEVESDAIAGGNKNSAAFGDWVCLTPEDAAKFLYKDLCSDAPHYSIMMDDDYRYIGVSVLPTVASDGTRLYTLVADFAG